MFNSEDNKEKDTEIQDETKENNKENKRKKKKGNTRKREHILNVNINVLEEKKENRSKVLKICTQTEVGTKADREKKIEWVIVRRR